MKKNKLGKFFGLGLSRTATTYLHELFQYNGLKSRHYPRELVLGRFLNDKMGWARECERVSSWKLKGFSKEFEKFQHAGAEALFNEHDLVLDLPITFYVSELFQAYPDAKFILTHREKSSWLESMKWMMTEGRIIWKYDVLDDFILRSVYGTEKFDEEALSAAYDSYHDNLETIFEGSRERLLTLKLPITPADFPRLSEFIGLSRDLVDVPRQNERRNSSLFDQFDYRLRSIRGYAAVKSVLLR